MLTSRQTSQGKSSLQKLQLVEQLLQSQHRALPDQVLTDSFNHILRNQHTRILRPPPPNSHPRLHLFQSNHQSSLLKLQSSSVILLLLYLFLHATSPPDSTLPQLLLFLRKERLSQARGPTNQHQLSILHKPVTSVVLQMKS